MSVCYQESGPADVVCGGPGRSLAIYLMPFKEAFVGHATKLLPWLRIHHVFAFMELSDVVAAVTQGYLL